MLADCGPIKRVDLIKTIDKATGEKLSRGFGFVTFALEADAARAVESVNGKRWGNRRFLMYTMATCLTEGILSTVLLILLPPACDQGLDFVEYRVAPQHQGAEEITCLPKDL